MPNLQVSFAGVTFDNPIVVASGTYGFGREYEEYMDLNELGGICVKGLTLHPRAGNLAPRVAETPAGMLNSVGLQNPGIDAFIRDELPYLKRFRPKIIANISGNTVEEYAVMAERLSAAGVDMLEVNVSCPNVKEGGIAFGTTIAGVTSVTEAVCKTATVPVMVKLSPNVTDIAAIARAAEASGADAISLINTLLGMRIDTTTRRPILRNNMGGLSGPAVFPVAVRMVYQVAKAVKIPILGMGGVMTGQDAAEMMIAGANIIAVGTACFIDPEAPLVVKRELLAYLGAMGIENVTDISNTVEVHA